MFPLDVFFEKLGSRMPMEIQSRTVTMRSKCQSPTWKCFEVGTSGKDNNTLTICNNDIQW